MIYLLMCLCLLFDIVYIVCKAKQKFYVGLLAKTLASLLFVCIGYFGYKTYPSNISLLVLEGLILGAFGDLFLGLRNLYAKNVNYIIGSLCFLCGHIMYFRSLFIMGNSYLFDSIVFAIVFGTLVLYLIYKICRYSDIYLVVGVIYIYTISIMTFSSYGVYFTNPSIRSLLFMIGSTLFYASDIILIVYNFSLKKKWMHPIYSLAYFLAQLIISYSIFL